eukprot:gnl/TRDRNA2_/TRDRNA2_81947_c0_seq1.p1 gnl/TRDRNA2_/TRDRNA2_81947_c0~~gnl/TRDRNA2_/TRDRNA2_81947_c0_seq1.p1  ORF type:complete len:293 (-),score=31.24 gnl/TRDRNA2_/TRDRNA2_81947_c0_seq1:303-1181(-)
MGNSTFCATQDAKFLSEAYYSIEYSPRPGAPRVGDPASGLGLFEVPVELLEPLRNIFQVLEDERRTGVFSYIDFIPHLGERQVGTYSFTTWGSAVSAAMRWIWANNEETLQLFEPLFQALIKAGMQPGPAAAPGTPLQLWSACFIVVRTTKLENTVWHVDLGAEAVPPGFGFSVLTPLYDLPPDACGIEVMPWPEPYDPESVNEEEGYTHQYRTGQLVAIDGKLFHRTAPFDLEQEDPSFVRVLVNLDVHPAAPVSAATGCRVSIEGQRHYAYFRPNKLADLNGAEDSENND